MHSLPTEVSISPAWTENAWDLREYGILHRAAWRLTGPCRQGGWFDETATRPGKRLR